MYECKVSLSFVKPITTDVSDVFSTLGLLGAVKTTVFGKVQVSNQMSTESTRYTLIEPVTSTHCKKTSAEEGNL